MKQITLLFAAIMLATAITGCGETASSAPAPTPSAEPAEKEAETVNEPEAAEEPETLDDDSLVSNYPRFKVTSENLNNGVWDDSISNTDQGENKSPQLSWDPVEGAQMYVIYMVDTSMQDFIHWKSDYITETNLPEGFASENEYIGPYPPEGGEHTYEIYVIALKKPVERIKGSLNGANMKFAQFIEGLDTDADGNTGNIAGGAHLVGTFKN